MRLRSFPLLALAALAGSIAGCSPYSEEVAGAEDGGGPADAGSSATDAVTSGNADAATTVTHDLVAWWRFDEPSGDVVVDHGPSGHGGRLVAGTAGMPERVTGQRGGALSFAAGSHALVAYEPSLDVGSRFSILFWVKAPADPGYQPRLLTHDRRWNIKLNDRAMQLSFDDDGYSSVAYALPADAWRHYAAVFDAGVMTWYVDGVLASNASNTFAPGSAPPASTGSLYFARYSESEPNFLTGSLDDVRIYGTVLTKAEIATIVAER